MWRWPAGGAGAGVAPGQVWRRGRCGAGVSVVPG